MNRTFPKAVPIWYLRVPAALCALVGPASVAGAAPAVVIEFQIEETGDERAQPIMDLLDPGGKDILRKKTTLDILERLRSRFPFVDWYASGQALSGGSQAGKLEVFMRASQGTGWTIFLACSATVGGMPIALKCSKANVYGPFDYLPERNNLSQPQLVEEVWRRTHAAIGQMFQDLSQCADSLISQIPLATDARCLDQSIVVPVAASRLRADWEETRLGLRFRSNWPEGSAPRECRMLLGTAGPFGDGGQDWDGMQWCLVKRFIFPPIDSSTWHESICEVFERRQDDSVRVFLETYKRESGGTAFVP